MPLSFGGDGVVSSVISCLHTDAADAGVIRATKELQSSQVDGTQRHIGRDTGATQSVPVVTLK